jgi:Mg/Co/Ni transporter MgtE
MSSAYVALPECTTVAVAIQALRSRPERARATSTVYLVESEATMRLTGAVWMPYLLLADPAAPLWTISEDDIPVGHRTECVADLVQTMVSSQIHALPITDDRGRLLGVVALASALTALSPRGAGSYRLSTSR